MVPATPCQPTNAQSESSKAFYLFRCGTLCQEDYVTLVRCGNLPSGEPLARFKEAEDIESHWGVNLNDDEEKEPSYAE